ncbi:methylated-DNA--[protein]-cysteine S-methyltransferase [Algiphilus sp.]|uniref:methylated-DNA--[protein]-cysteine S-methyltransferase n=1 Tax=Algiphilus sp. TaxID=1872431 RepID=UPI003C67ED9D
MSATPSDPAMRRVTFDSPLGPLTAGAVDDGVCLLGFADREKVDRAPRDLRAWLDGTAGARAERHLDRLQTELAAYFRGRLTTFTVPLVTPGTAFQRAVWEALRAIPYAATCSYRDIATAVGNPGAVRAVGTTNGRNRIALVIPCHRVINAGGGLGGYGGGLDRKRWLLDLERSTAASATTAPLPSTTAAAP